MGMVLRPSRHRNVPLERPERYSDARASARCHHTGSLGERNTPWGNLTQPEVLGNQKKKRDPKTHQLIRRRKKTEEGDIGSLSEGPAGASLVATPRVRRTERGSAADPNSGGRARSASRRAPRMAAEAVGQAWAKTWRGRAEQRGYYRRDE